MCHENDNLKYLGRQYRELYLMKLLNFTTNVQNQVKTCIKQGQKILFLTEMRFSNKLMIGIWHY